MGRHGLTLATLYPMIAPVESNVVATLPQSSTAIRSPKGKQVGTRYFIGTASASSLRETGKRLGMKGSALKDYVNKALTDEAASRAAAVAATVSALSSKGFIADTVDVRKASASIRFLKPAESKVKADKVSALEAEIAALKAQLAAK